MRKNPSSVIFVHALLHHKSLVGEIASVVAYPFENMSIGGSEEEQDFGRTSTALL